MTDDQVNVLVVDDDDTVAELVALKLRGCAVSANLIAAEDGRAGLDILKGRRRPLHGPVVVVLDLHMPRMGGFDFLRELRADTALRSTVVFVYTSSPREADRSRAFAGAVAGYLVKGGGEQQFAELARLIESYGTPVSPQ
jgi:CheY-like chemotaxis protein